MIKKSSNSSRAEAKVREEILKLIKAALAKDFNESLISLDYPPDSKMGDLSLPCFLLAKKLKISPVDAAKNLAAKIKPRGLVKTAVAAGPYLNFFVSAKDFSQLVLTEVAKEKNTYGQTKIGQGQKVMVEYFSPNTNKPLTIGHARNICLGDSLARLLKFAGYQVIRSTLYNDRGIAIAKTILGYQKWGNGQTPDQAELKPDHFVGNFYVQLAQAAKKDPALEKQARQVLQAWEKNNQEIKKLWRELMDWVIAGFRQTLEKLGVAKFDEEYFESQYYKQGKKVVAKGLAKKVFVKDKEGVILAPLEKYGIADKIVLRPDDTSLYITQDLYLAYLKDKHHLDASVYVVGSEQDLYFKQLFKILELLGFKNAKNYHHLSYGMIRLSSGKIKSREGLVKGTGADELIAELQDLAQAEIKKRDKEISAKDLAQRAQQIALAALKFYILVVNPKTTMIFEPKKSLAFTGRTGPYLQYVYARINSIFAKTKIKPETKVDFEVLDNELEFELVRLLSRFPQIINQAVARLDPADLANYLFDLAQAFSSFYETLPVLKAEEKVKKVRLLLIADVQIVLAIGLELLGIEAPEKM